MGNIIITPDPLVPPLGEVVRMDSFPTINITASLDIVEPMLSGSVVSTTVVPQFDVSGESDLIITNGVNTASIGGVYNGRFFDVIKYLPPCSSDKIDDLITVIGIGNVPEGKQIVEFIQDVSVQWYSLYYIIEVYYEYVDDVGEGSDTETFIYEHRNLNDWVKPGEWLSQYVERNTFDGCL